MRVERPQVFRYEYLLLFVFAALFGTMSVLSPNQFLKPFNLQSMAFQLPEFGILALAQMVIILTGGINLSVTYTAALSSIVGSVFIVSMNAAHASPVMSICIGVIIMLVLGLMAGLFNGIFVAIIGVSAILVTLGTMTLFDGLSITITREGGITGYPAGYLDIGNGTLLGIPVPMVIFLLVLLLTYYLIGHTSFGFKLYMVGANAKATAFSGVNTRKVLLMVYLYSGLLCAIAGLIMSSRYNSAKETYGSSYLLQSIAAAVLGGTDIVGGSGTVLGVLLAVMILQVVSTGLNVLGINPFLITVVMGCILIIALSLNSLGLRRAQKGTRFETSTFG